MNQKHFHELEEYCKKIMLSFEHPAYKKLDEELRKITLSGKITDEKVLGAFRAYYNTPEGQRWVTQEERPRFLKDLYSEFNIARKEAFQRDKGQCQQCGALGGSDGRKCHVHHKLPVLQGGGHEITNLITLCSGCHWKAHQVQPKEGNA